MTPREYVEVLAVEKARWNVDAFIQKVEMDAKCRLADSFLWDLCVEAWDHELRVQGVGE